MKENKPRGEEPEKKDLQLLILIYSVIGVILLLVLQIGRFKSTQQRFQVTAIVLLVVLGIGYRVTRKFKSSMESRENIESKKKKEKEILLSMAEDIKKNLEDQDGDEDRKKEEEAN